MEKIRREVLENQLKRIAPMLGKTSGDAWTRIGDRNVSRIGTLNIDHSSCYGGYNVEEIVNESGAVSHPFGDRRLHASEFWALLNGIERALQIKKGANESERRLTGSINGMRFALQELDKACDRDEAINKNRYIGRAINGLLKTLKMAIAEEV